MDSSYSGEYCCCLGEVIVEAFTFPSHMESDHGELFGRYAHEGLNDITGLLSVTDGELLVDAPLFYFLPLSVDLPVTLLNCVEISLADIVKKGRNDDGIVLKLKKT